MAHKSDMLAVLYIKDGNPSHTKILIFGWKNYNVKKVDLQCNTYIQQKTLLNLVFYYMVLYYEYN
jgi:hypothetical protein